MWDVSGVLDNIGVGNYHYVQLLIVGGIFFADGAEMLFSSSIIGALAAEWELNSLTRGLMMSVIFLGVFAGGLVGGTCGDKYGRRPVIFWSYAGLLVFGLGTAATNGPWGMVALRFCFGASFGAGIGPALALIMETTPPNVRGQHVNYSYIFFYIGEVYTAILLMCFMPELIDTVDKNNWRRLTLITIIPGAMLIFPTYFLLRESPYFLLSQGRSKEALVSLKYIASMNGRKDVVQGLEALEAEPLGTDPEASSSSTFGRSSIGEVDQDAPTECTTLLTGGAAQKKLSPASLSENFSFQAAWHLLSGPEYRSIVLGGMYLCFYSNFIYYGLSYSLPQVFRKFGATINPSQHLFVSSIAAFPGAALTHWLLLSRAIGHRDGLSLMALALVLSHLALVGIDHGSPWLWVGLIAAPCAKFFAVAFFTLVYIYLVEVFPASVRCTAIALNISAGRAGGMVSPLCFELLTAYVSSAGMDIGAHAPYFMLNLILSLVAIVAIKSLLSFELKNTPLPDDKTPSTL